MPMRKLRLFVFRCLERLLTAPCCRFGYVWGCPGCHRHRRLKAWLDGVA